MESEFDPRKSDANFRKHDIDFVAAQALWNDGTAIRLPGQTSDEDCSLLVGRVDRVLWTAVITMRGSRIRIISVRRARKNERSVYESQGF